MKKPDRVPVIEFIVDRKVARKIYPDFIDIQDFMDQVGYDAVCCKPVFSKIKENDDGTYVDEWGVTYKADDLEEVAHPLRGPIETFNDAVAYSPPDPDAPHRLSNLPDVVARYKGKRAILIHHRVSFMLSAYLMGLDNLLASFLLEPKLAELVMDKVLETNMRIIRNAIRAGAEVIVLADDYAHNHGPLMSPDIVREFIIPRLEKMVDMIKSEGAFCIKHTDGNIYSILDMIVATGVNAIDPVEPVAGMDLKTVKNLVGDRVCIVGNIDCGELLSHGTAGDVEEAVIQAIHDAGDGGGYIVSSSNSIHSSVKPENLVAMIEAVQRHGRYS